MIKKSAILVSAAVFSLISLAIANSICVNAPCEKQINVSAGKDFTISLEANPSTGFGWWTNFDTKYLSLVNSTFISGGAGYRKVGAPGTEIFTFNAKEAGNTEVVMLLLRPWVNGTIIESKLFPINIVQLSNNKSIYDVQQYSHVKPPYYTIPFTTLNKVSRAT